ncbi:hypothetical protein B0H19DRAFT_1119208 [Mycena capillaripes]|nr:hypothetical protein B0H19DRAFT_1119208 [Mycena capillaripes]
MLAIMSAAAGDRGRQQNEKSHKYNDCETRMQDSSICAMDIVTCILTARVSPATSVSTEYLPLRVV